MNWKNLKPGYKIALGAGGVLLVVVLYKRLKSAPQNTGAATAGAPTGGCPSGYMDDGTGTGNCIPVPAGASSPGGGYGGGGGGDGGLGQEILSTLQGIQSSLPTSTNSSTPTGTTTSSDTSTSAPATSTNTPTQSQPVTVNPTTGLPSSTATVRQGSSQGSKLPFQTSVTKTVAGTTYYGLPNIAASKAATSAGYKTITGAALEKRYPSQKFTAGATYAYK